MDTLKEQLANLKVSQLAHPKLSKVSRPDGCLLEGKAAVLSITPGGEMRATIPDVLECAECGGSATRYTIDSYGYHIASPCKGSRLARGVASFNAARLPAAGYHDLVADDSRYGEELLAAIASASRWKHLEGRWRPQRERGLVLWGPVGTGKSYWLWRIAKHLSLSVGLGVRWIDVKDFLHDLKGAYSSADKAAAQKLQNPLMNCTVLVLDDLGKDGSDHERSVMDVIISHRYQRGLTLLATSQYDPDELGDRIGFRLTSRLRETCNIVHVPGEDRRGRR